MENYGEIFWGRSAYSLALWEWVLCTSSHTEVCPTAMTQKLIRDLPTTPRSRTGHVVRVRCTGCKSPHLHECAPGVSNLEVGFSRTSFDHNQSGTRQMSTDSPPSPISRAGKNAAWQPPKDLWKERAQTSEDKAFQTPLPQDYVPHDHPHPLSPGKRSHCLTSDTIRRTNGMETA